MAQTEFEDDLEESGGGFSRFMFFVTPILFTVVLLGVLLTLFNLNFRNTLLELADKIPVVKNFVPDPEASNDVVKKELEKKQEESTEATVKQLKEQVAKQEADLKAATEKATEEADRAKQLEEELTTLQAEKTEQKETEEQAAYQKEVKKLAQLYSQMSPSKAAAILDNLTTDETLQMLSMMGNESKVAILEKMDPKKAAEISILLKDVKQADDLAIAALQSRIKKGEEEQAEKQQSASGLDDDQLSQTVASMSSESSAQLLLQTYKISPDKALKVLRAVDSSTRSKILEAMSEEDETLSAKIFNQLFTK